MGVKLVTETQISDGRVWYTVKPEYQEWGNRKATWDTMDLWCTDTLGQGGMAWRGVSTEWWDLDTKWLANNGKFWFKYETDMLMFVLKFSSID